jgi:hypothetical protein
MFLIGFTQAQNIQEKSIEYNNLMPNGIVKISIEHKEAMVYCVCWCFLRIVLYGKSQKGKC